jgi:hypothetical protein
LEEKWHRCSKNCADAETFAEHRAVAGAELFAVRGVKANDQAILFNVSIWYIYNTVRYKVTPMQKP